MTAKTNFLLIALFATSLVPALRAENDCTAATVSGGYGFSGNGFEAVHKSAAATAKSASQAATPGFAPVTFVGLLSFTGDGMVSGSFTANGNGHQEKADPFTGAYVVNADCTGLVAVTEKDGHESHFTVTITDGGKELLAMQTDDGSARTFVARKQ
jgi:hypothetical protein